jgi:hypothetical protein
MLMVIESAQKQAGAATKLLFDLRETAARPWWRKLLGS